MPFHSIFSSARPSEALKLAFAFVLGLGPPDTILDLRVGVCVMDIGGDCDYSGGFLWSRIRTGIPSNAPFASCRTRAYSSSCSDGGLALLTIPSARMGAEQPYSVSLGHKGVAMLFGRTEREVERL